MSKSIILLADLNNPKSLWEQPSWQAFPNYTGPYIIPVEISRPSSFYVPYNQNIPTTSQNYDVYQQILSPQKYEICKNCSSFIFQTKCNCFENREEAGGRVISTFGTIVRSSSFDFYDLKNYDLMGSCPIYRSKSDVFDGNVIAQDIRMSYLNRVGVE